MLTVCSKQTTVCYVEWCNIVLKLRVFFKIFCNLSFFFFNENLENLVYSARKDLFATYLHPLYNEYFRALKMTILLVGTAMSTLMLIFSF